MNHKFSFSIQIHARFIGFVKHIYLIIYELLAAFTFYMMII
jgi:hypothetical protein